MTLDAIGPLFDVIIAALLTVIALNLRFLVKKLTVIDDPQWAFGVNDKGEFIDEHGNPFTLPDPIKTPGFGGAWGRLDYIACSLQLQNRILARSGRFTSVHPK